MDSSSVSTLARESTHRLAFGEWTIPTRHSPIGKCSFGQGSLYGWVYRIVWLLRVTESECTSGLLDVPAVALTRTLESAASKLRNYGYGAHFNPQILVQALLGRGVGAASTPAAAGWKQTAWVSKVRYRTCSLYLC